MHRWIVQLDDQEEYREDVRCGQMAGPAADFGNRGFWNDTIERAFALRCAELRKVIFAYCLRFTSLGPACFLHSNGYFASVEELPTH
jgi:hypothetical protein